MNNNFTSDFSLFPIKKMGKPGWEYRKATWASEMDSEVHKLYNDDIPGPLYYNRIKIRDGTTERCKICKHGDDIHVEPGNGFDYLVRIDSLNNVIIDDNSNNNNTNNDNTNNNNVNGTNGVNNVNVNVNVNDSNNTSITTNDQNILQQLECIVCLTNKRTHIIKECNHFVLCQECSINIFNSDKKCPMCRCQMIVPAKKVFF